MKSGELMEAMGVASEAAFAAGELMSKNLARPKRIHSSEQHDIKLELDVRCQKRIERMLRLEYPAISFFGEEGASGDPESEYRWVVDPIDGTVNFTYGIPHACVSIALQRRLRAARRGEHPDAPFQTELGVVYDPFADELFTAIRGRPALLNSRRIRVSDRTRLDEAIISVGFAKSASSLEKMLPQFNSLVHKVRKIRIMGAAALAMVYVAAGRFDGYVEGGVRLWDIAAGGLILECAGGDFFHEPAGLDHTYRIVANNGRLRRKLAAA